MAIIKCGNCGKQHSDKAPVCPFCEGKPPTPQKPPMSARMLPVAKSLVMGASAVKKAMFRYRKFKADCPMCQVNLTMKIEADTVPETYFPNESVRKLGVGDCPFCKTDLAIVVDEDGIVAFRDARWEEAEKKHADKINALEDEISDIECNLEEGEDEDGEPLTAKQRTAGEKRLKSLQARLEKLDESFADRAERYYDRQLKWQEKADRKFGG